MAVTAQRQVATATAQRNFYGAYAILIRNLRNGNGETATAERQRNGGNQASVGPAVLLLSIIDLSPSVGNMTSSCHVMHRPGS